MGAPALVTVLREDERVETYSWRSGGYSLARDLIAYGVEGFVSTALRHGWTREPGADLEPTRIHIGWAESFLIIDYRNRSLLWSQHDLDLDPPRLISHLFEQSCPGWKTVWCPYGDDALWRYLCGNSSVSYREPKPKSRNWILDEGNFAPFTDPEESFGEDTLFTAILSNGEPACWLSDKCCEQVTAADISDIEKIADSMPGTTFEQYPVWPFNDGNYDNWPRGGVHLDFVQYRAWRWREWGIRWDHFIPDLWPGWDFIEIGDCAEVQAPYVNGRLIQEPLNRCFPNEEPVYAYPRSNGEIEAEKRVLELCTSGLKISPAAFLQLDGTVCWNPLELIK